MNKTEFNALCAELDTLSARINDAWHQRFPHRGRHETPYITRDLDVVTADLRENSHAFIVPETPRVKA